MTTRVAIAGARGKMGRLFETIIGELDGFDVVARLGRESDLDELNDADLVVDVTNPDASPAIVEHAARQGAAVLIGTSGWSESRVTSLSNDVPDGVGILIIPNFSLGSVLGTTLATIAARFYDSIEIIEAHRQSKADSPSGTAVRTAELMSAARESAGPVAAPHTDQRARGQQVAGIPIHSLRLSGVVAQQEVILGGTGETLTIRHDTINPSAYRRGIELSLHAVLGLNEIVVGLENVLELGISRA